MRRSCLFGPLTATLALTHLAACGDSLRAPGGDAPSDAGPRSPADAAVPAEQLTDAWARESTLSQRHALQVPAANQYLSAAEMQAQLAHYDPAATFRCPLAVTPAFADAIEALGGIDWGYRVPFLRDMSKPLIRLGPALPVPFDEQVVPADPNHLPSESDQRVTLSDDMAIYQSPSHGLLLIDLAQGTPRVRCALKLPGSARDFVYHQGHLVGSFGSRLMHLKLDEQGVTFVELLQLEGSVRQLRKVSDRLVVYSELPLPGRDASLAQAHRALRVFELGERLSIELQETLLDTSRDPALMYRDLPADAAPGSTLSGGSAYADIFWADDRHFVIAEVVRHATVAPFQPNTERCTQQRDADRDYTHCSTTYASEPNPQHVAPDPDGTWPCRDAPLATCVTQLARAASATQRAPTGTSCEAQSWHDSLCDVTSYVAQGSPILVPDAETKLYVYAVTDAGTRLVADDVSEIIATPGLEQAAPSALSLRDEHLSLRVPGAIRALHFEGPLLYVMTDRHLHTYALGEASLVRTSALDASGSFDATGGWFGRRQLFFHDYEFWSTYTNQHTNLRGVDLTNPAFPRLASAERQLLGSTLGQVLSFGAGLLILQDPSAALTTTSHATLDYRVDPFARASDALNIAADAPWSAGRGPDTVYHDSARDRVFTAYLASESAVGESASYGVQISRIEGDHLRSEGQLSVPEDVEFLKPHADTDALAFAPNTLSTLALEDDQWAHQAYFENYDPIALYRISDDEEYVEVLRHGGSCKLRFTSATTLDVRTSERESAAFACEASRPWAHTHHIVFTHGGVRFDPTSRSVQVLTPEEVTQLEQTRDERTCVYSEQATDAELDAHALPPVADLRCYAPDAYAAKFGGASF